MAKEANKVLIFGWGTFEPIRNHLALSAPAFGSTAKQLHELIPGSELLLTKMAWWLDTLKTNDDVERKLKEILDTSAKEIKAIIMNVAFCDFKGKIGDIEPSFHAQRLKTQNWPITIEASPTKKVLASIRQQFPEIFLVWFKTTTGSTEYDQFMTALKFMKSSKCNLVLANDVTERRNIILTPEETYYGPYPTRGEALQDLVDMTLSRSDGTFNRTIFHEQESFSTDLLPGNFQTILQRLIANGWYIENNGNGFTPGHFCFKLDDKSFLSSQRKANHNQVFVEGMTKIVVENDTDSKNPQFHAYWKRKASVGARSQYLMLQDNPQFDCIIHTHNPIKSNSIIPGAAQKPFQCWSLQCGMNTLNHLSDFWFCKAVYLEKHWPNIIFNSNTPPEMIIKFIQDNFELGVKTT